MQWLWRDLIALVVIVTSVVPQVAAARPRVKRARVAESVVHEGHATIVAINDGELVLDAGEAQGLRLGQTIALYRTIRARHPVTGVVVADRFLVGKVTIDEVAGSMSIVRPSEAMLKMLHPGDPVEYTPPSTSPAPVELVSGRGQPVPSGTASAVGAAPATPRCPDCPVCPPGGVTAPEDQETRAARRAFDQTLGKTPPERIQTWVAFLTAWPNGRYASPVRAELAVWERQESTASRISARAPNVEHRSPGPVRVGEEVWLTFAATDWSAVEDLRVHVRTTGQGAYTLLRPEPSGRLHRRVRLADAYVGDTSGIQYLVEVGMVDGTTRRIGSSQAPLNIEVLPALDARVTRVGHSTSLRLGGEYVDFNRFRGDDREIAAEAELVYRMQDPGWLYAFGVGYGVMNGRGGRVAAADQYLAPGVPRLHETGPRVGQPILRNDTLDVHSASFKYAWLSAELELHPVVHWIARLVVGVSGSQTDDGLDVGVEGYLRLGLERGTNLRIGGSTLADMGRAGSIALTSNVVQRLPMTLLIEATNRPVAADIGLRLVYEATWWASDGVGLTARVGYNLRTIEHVGMSAGGGVTLRW